MQEKYKSGYETNLADKSSLTAQTLTDSSFTGGSLFSLFQRK